MKASNVIMYWYVFNQHKLIISTCTVKLIGGKTILCQLVHAHVRTHTHTVIFIITSTHY